MNSSSLQPLTVHVLSIPRHDRWQAYQRLQELDVPCQCLVDGRLQVDVSHPTAIVQLKSVVQQLTAPRAELVNWLKQCWQQAS